MKIVDKTDITTLEIPLSNSDSMTLPFELNDVQKANLIQLVNEPIDILTSRYILAVLSMEITTNLLGGLIFDLPMSQLREALLNQLRQDLQLGISNSDDVDANFFIRFANFRILVGEFAQHICTDVMNHLYASNGLHGFNFARLFEYTSPTLDAMYALKIIDPSIEWESKFTDEEWHAICDKIINMKQYQKFHYLSCVANLRIIAPRYYPQVRSALGDAQQIYTDLEIQGPNCGNPVSASLLASRIQAWQMLTAPACEVSTNGIDFGYHEPATTPPALNSNLVY